MPNTNILGKKAAMFLAFREFRDAEYFIPAEILKSVGVKIINVSTQKGTAFGADGGEVEIDLTTEELLFKDFDALVFIGGSGIVKDLENQDLHKLARDFVGAGKILAAICIAPVILAKAGVLQGKKATVWSGPMDRSSINILKESGSSYQKEDVVIDGSIITANGPNAAAGFGEALARKLKA